MLSTRDSSASRMRKEKLQSLDGLRAISVGGVLLGHLIGTAGFPLSESSVGATASLGVLTFFVISGFLITTLLINEVNVNGRISLRRFFIRRFLRLAPAFFVFMACMYIANQLGLVSLQTRDFIHSLTWTVNYQPDRSWALGHIWSLSVEEQFYLLWPTAVAFVGVSGGLKIAAALLALAPICRGAIRVFASDTILVDIEPFPAVADALAIGCAVAMTRDRLLQSQLWRSLTNPAAAIPLGILALAIQSYRGYTFVDVVFTPLALVALVAVVEGSTRYTGFAQRLLNGTIITWFGLISYSLYLWQQPFLNRNEPASLTSFPINLCCAMILGCASYYWIEQPLRSLRNRYH